MSAEPRLRYYPGVCVRVYRPERWMPAPGLSMPVADTSILFSKLDDQEALSVLGRDPDIVLPRAMYVAWLPRRVTYAYTAGRTAEAEMLPRDIRSIVPLGGRTDFMAFVLDTAFRPALVPSLANAGS